MPEPPRPHEGPIIEAHRHAQREREPVLMPDGWFADDRGFSLMNLLQGVLAPEGQINYSVMYPNVVKAWHRHQRQTDFWLCLQGHLKVGVHREEDDARWQVVIGETRPAIMIIPPSLWHGAATVGPTSAGLLYYVTHQYDPDAPDEQRRPWDEPADFPWRVQFK